MFQILIHPQRGKGQLSMPRCSHFDQHCEWDVAGLGTLDLQIAAMKFGLEFSPKEPSGDSESNEYR